jgi:DNA-binding transcriptional MerR regulator
MSKPIPRTTTTTQRISIQDAMSTNDLMQFLADQEADTHYIGIADMAKKCQTTFRTLRFYEARGLLKPRRHGVNRLYDTHAQRRYKLIDEGRKLGFTLSEIAELLGPSSNVSELKLSVKKIKEQIAHLERQRVEIEEALASLRKRYYMLSEPGFDS